MKHILSILLAILPLVAFAQKATVESVVADPLNISASKYPMTDLNGRTAPLVIVRVLADNVEFQGSVLDGGVVKKTGEYWVYMGAGAKMLHIHSDRFLPVEINFPAYDIPRLEPSTTYIITLTLPQAAAQQSAAAGYNYLVLNVSPANAQVTIDGKSTDVQADGTAKRLLRTGATYSYRVEAPGYMPEEGTVAIAGQKVERTIALRSTRGSLSVTTATAGTEIYVNGDRVGAGSWSGELQPGDYLVEGRLAGHRSVEQLVSISTGDNRTVALPALTAITGTLNVDYSPSGAAITIDGTAHGTTPNVIDGVPVGTHTVAISSPGYTTATLTATVNESDLTTLEGSLVKAPEEDEVFIAVEQQPQFPGGERAMFKWLTDHINYPKVAVENNVQGRVHVQFEVSKTGTIENVRIARGCDPALDEEAIRVVKTMPNWIPGQMNGAPVKVQFTVPISFNLQGAGPSTTPVHLALCATGPDGRTVYITAEEWKGLSSSARASYKPLGICLMQGSRIVLIELQDKEDGKGMDWNTALKYNLPTKEQGEIIAENSRELNNALNAFGGTSMNSGQSEFYWTKTQSDSDNAWAISMANYCVTGYLGKHAPIGRVRAVALIPTAAR